MDIGNAGDIVVITNFFKPYFIVKPHVDPQLPVVLVPANGAKLGREKALDLYAQELVDISQKLSQKGIS
jgi:hypothetical protein